MNHTVCEVRSRRELVTKKEELADAIETEPVFKKSYVRRLDRIDKQPSIKVDDFAKRYGL